MGQPVTIENDAIVMEVWPSFGGKVASVIDKADKFELMFNYPNELPTAPRYDAPFDSGWYAGWDECFPAVAASRYPGHPYDGIRVPDHGELWGLPTTSVPTKSGITTVWHGLRFGYRLTRKLHLENNVLLAEYALINLAPFPFSFVWAQHCLLSMQSPVVLEIEGKPSFKYSHDAAGNEYQTAFDWPLLAGDLDLSQLEKLPAKRGWKVFSNDPIAGELVVRYPQRKRSLTIQHEGEDGATAYWGIWINTGGWNGHRHFAIEPTTGKFDQIDRAMGDGSAGNVGPLGRKDWSVRWVLGTG